MELRIYTINFQYSDEGEVTFVTVSFNSVNNGQEYLSGSVSLTSEEFNSGNTLDQVKAKLVERLSAVPKTK